MRHGEATDNVNELISDKEIYWSVLTEKGKNTVLETINNITQKIDKIYVSPFPRTIETAHFLYLKYPKTEVIIEKRLHEIYYGKYSFKKNNNDLDNTRLKQIDGDYAHLQRIDRPEEELKLVARALLPIEIYEGCILHYEMMQYSMK